MLGTIILFGLFIVFLDKIIERIDKVKPDTKLTIKKSVVQVVMYVIVFGTIELFHVSLISINVALCFPIIQLFFYLISGILFKAWFGESEIEQEEKIWMFFLNEISVGITMLFIVSDTIEERYISLFIIFAYIFGNHFPYSYLLNNKNKIKKDIEIWGKNYLEKIGIKWAIVSSIISIFVVIFTWFLSTYRESVNSAEIGIGIGCFISCVVGISTFLITQKKREEI